jgi:hypothetical protein
MFNALQLVLFFLCAIDDFDRFVLKAIDFTSVLSPEKAYDLC